MAKLRDGSLEPNEPMRKWERLVKEHMELSEDTGRDTSKRRREINQELQDMHRRHREENPQFFRDANQDEEFER